jgi:hypothetical protein
MNFMVKKLGRFEEREGGATNSHSQTSLPRYKEMLRRFNVEMGNDSYQLSIDKLRAILKGNPKS